MTGVRSEYTFAGLFAAMATAAPSSAPVLEDGSIQLTPTSLLEAVSFLRGELGRHLLPGMRVCSLLPSGAPFLVAQAAIVDLGGCFIAVPSDAPYLAETAIAATHADWLLVDVTSDVADLAARHRGVGILLVDLRGRTVEAIRQRLHARPLRAVDDASLGLVTSGSTGVPKVVGLSESTYCYAAVSLAEQLSLGARDRLLHTLPIQRGAGLLCWGGLACGARSRIEPTRSRDLAEALRGWGATGVFAVSTGVHALAVGGEDRSSLPSLRTLYYASGPVTRELKRDIAERFGDVLFQDYGLTEVPEPLTVFSRADHALGASHPALASVGRPIHEGRVALDAGANEFAPAVVQVRSPWMFSGYWRDGVLQPPRLAEGWLNTDDLGYFDADGYLHLKGRVSATVRGGGVAFPLNDVLSLVRAAPHVLDARVRVVGDDRLGERVVADVVLRPEGQFDAEALRLHLKGAASDIRMVPSEVRLVSSLDTETVALEETL